MEWRKSYLSLLVFALDAFSFQNCESAMQEQVPEAFDPMAFPVFNSTLQVFYCFDTFFAVDGSIGTLKNRRRGFDADRYVCLAFLVEISLVVQLLQMMSKNTIEWSVKAYR